MKVEKGMRTLDIIVAILMIIGGLNWGFVGFFNFNVIASIFGEASAVTRLIYALVGLGALYELFELTFGLKSTQHRWCETLATVKH